MRFKDFTDDELDVLEDALCEYGGSPMIKEIRKEREQRKINERYCNGVTNGNN